MRTLTMAAVALGAATTMLTPPTVQAGVPVAGPTGQPCRSIAITDPNPEADANDVTGVIMVGPAITNEPGKVVCTIQVNEPTHDGPDAVTRWAPSSTGGVVFGIQLVSYSIAEDVKEYICTSFDPDDPSKPTLYWTEEPVARWHTDPSKDCSPTTALAAHDGRDAVAAVLCPEIAVDHGWHAHGNAYIDEEGDVFVDGNLDGIHENFPDGSDAMADLVYDCPRYTVTINDPTANPDRDDPGNPGVIDW